MSWADRLHQKMLDNPPGQPLTKPTKSSFVSSGSSQPGGFEEKTAQDTGNDPTAFVRSVGSRQGGIPEKITAANDADVTADALLAAYGERLPIEVGPDGRVTVRTAEVLRYAEAGDWPDLCDPGVMHALACSLADEGLITTERCIPALPGAGVRCIDCRHFQRFDDHPHLGGCGVGVPPTAAAGFWDSAIRHCEQFTRGTIHD